MSDLLNDANPDELRLLAQQRIVEMSLNRWGRAIQITPILTLALETGTTYTKVEINDHELNEARKSGEAAFDTLLIRRLAQAESDLLLGPPHASSKEI